MPTGVWVVIAVPAFALIVGLWLHHLYGDELFGLEWPGRDLDNPNDTRLLKLNLNGAADEHRERLVSGERRDTGGK